MDRNGSKVCFFFWFHVVPYVGTWIEIALLAIAQINNSVVPYVGTWIEMRSHFGVVSPDAVVPYVGTWIEIL